MLKKPLLIKVSLCCIGFLAFVFALNAVGGPYLNAVFSKEASVVSQPKKKVMYLTFDDGPSQNTPEVLKILKKYKIHATFFVTGAELDYASYIKQAYEEGNVIGIHSYSHEYDEIYQSESAYLEDLRKTSDLILEQTGHKTNLFRFPGGSSNTVSRHYSPSIITALTKKLTACGYQYYDWNASNGDGNPNLDSNTLVNQALRETKGLDEVMMLMHDGTGNHATVEALPILIEAFQKQGYTFEVIQTGTDGFHHHIAN